MEIIIGALRVIGLQGLSLLFGAWLNPLVKAAIGGAVALGLAVTVYAFWPSAGNPIEDAVREALGQRETITNINIDEEKRDNDWLVDYQKWMAAERAAAAGAAKADAAGDRVIWGADDPWLRSKRSAKAR
jgi:hypothetical protein